MILCKKLLQLKHLFLEQKFDLYRQHPQNQIKTTFCKPEATRMLTQMIATTTALVTIKLLLL